MPWFKVDDQMAFHEKIVMAGNEATGAWARAGAWSSGRGTEGRIPRHVALTIAPARIWRLLVTAVLCHEIEDGWELHDFLDYNPTAEDAERTREARSKAGQLGGQRSAEARKLNASKQASNGEAKPEANASLGAEPKTASGARLTRRSFQNDATVDSLRHDAERDPIRATSHESGQASAQANAAANGKQSSTPIPIPIPIPSEDHPQTPSGEKKNESENETRFALGTAGLLEAEQTYQSAVAEAFGSAVAIRFRISEREILASALNTHFRATDKPAAIALMTRSAAAWVRDTLDRDGAKYTNGWSPAKFLEWLNTRPKPGAKQVPFAKHASKPAPYHRELPDDPTIRIRPDPAKAAAYAQRVNGAPGTTVESALASGSDLGVNSAAGGAGGGGTPHGRGS